MSLFTVHDSTRTRFSLCAMQCTYTAKGNSSLIRCWTPLKCPDITEAPSYDWAIMGMSFKPHDCNPSLIPETIPAASRELEQSTKQINRSLIWSPSVYLMQTESCSVFDDFASSAITARKPVSCTFLDISSRTSSTHNAIISFWKSLLVQLKYLDCMDLKSGSYFEKKSHKLK